MKYELVIFDLDGTLLDTSSGIFNSVRYAEKEMGFLPIKDDRLREFVGPPPKSMYMKIYNVDEATAFQAAQKHREYGRSKAIFEAKVYPGIEELLQSLKENGYKLAVSTLKAQKIAESVLKNFALFDYFDAVIGMDEKESLTKSMTIRQAIRQTGTAGNVLMIGDSQYDYDGAIEENVDFIGAMYGFGFSNSAVYPFDKIQTPGELTNYL